MTTRAYAGQSWVAELFHGPMVLTSLEIIARDLKADAKQAGITGPVIELWSHAAKNTKGFFVGDTAELVQQGWTKLATL